MHTTHTVFTILGFSLVFIVPILYLHHLDVKATAGIGDPVLIHATCKHVDLTPAYAKSAGQLLGEAMAPLMVSVLEAVLTKSEKAHV